jgi:zinc/manganese transport system ATP-binding protein
MTRSPAADIHDAAPISLHDLTVAYRGHPAVHHLSGAFAAGSLTAIVGPNGAGKTSLVAAIAGAIAPSQGTVNISEAVRGHIAWLPQQAAIDRSFPIRVFDLVALGHWSRVGSFRAISRSQSEQVLQALDAVGLRGFERRGIAELSAGQFQRVLFARVLLQDSPVILLDEPFTAIDARTTADLLAVVARWHAESRTVIAVLHDLDQVRAHFEHTLLLARRCVAWGPTAEVLRAENLFRARQMAEAWDEDAPACEEAA